MLIEISSTTAELLEEFRKVHGQWSQMMNEQFGYCDLPDDDNSLIGMALSRGVMQCTDDLKKGVEQL